MAKTGYLCLTKEYSAREEDIQWIKDFGCDDIIVNEWIQEKPRLQWSRTLTLQQPVDEIVITGHSNALRGIREFGALLAPCREFKVHPVSIHDRIDSKNEFFPETTAGNVLDTIRTQSIQGRHSLRSFSGVKNDFVMAGKKGDDLGEKIGYYGEQLVQLAQPLGLNTGWTGLSYSKVPGTYELEDGEMIGCFIALGYGETQGAGKENLEWLYLLCLKYLIRECYINCCQSCT